MKKTVLGGEEVTQRRIKYQKDKNKIENYLLLRSVTRMRLK
jgi:hypothetical protein